MGGIAVPLLATTLLLLLLTAGVEDARTREIADWKNIVIAALAPLWWWTHDLSLVEIAWQIGIATLVFGFFYAMFAIGQMGGGDVKMVAALVLWLPPASVMPVLMVMALVGGLLTLLIIVERWRLRTTTVPEIPYGIAIAIAGMLAIANPILTHFGDA